MISAGKLEGFIHLDADRLTDIVIDNGHDISDEPFIMLTFKGMNSRSAREVDFLYDGVYLDTHGEGGLQYAGVIVTYDTFSEKITADYAA
jgi:hypothetical protein